jgi:hypothetical protein
MSGEATTATATTAATTTAATTETTATIAEPFYKDLIISDGKINEKSWERLPDHLKPHADTFKKYKTVDELFAGFGNLSHLAGKKALAPLPENAPPELKAERDRLLDSLMEVPDKPEGYGFKRPDDLPEEVWDPEFAGEAAKIMREEHMGRKAANRLLELNIKQARAGIAEAQARMAAEAQAEEGKLREAWPADQYDRNLALVTRLIATAGLDPKDSMPPTAAGRIGLLKIASMLQEDKLVAGGDDHALAAGNDRARALDIVNNEANPLYKAYHDGNDPRHKQALGQVMALNESYARRMKAAGRPI